MKKVQTRKSRSLSLLRKRGFIVDGEAESYNPFTQRKHDLFNFIDIAAVHKTKPGLGVLAVQVTNGGDLQAHLRKVDGLPGYWAWLDSGNPVEFHAWRKIKDGTKRLHWVPKIVRVTFESALLGS